MNFCVLADEASKIFRDILIADKILKIKSLVTLYETYIEIQGYKI